MRQNPIPVPFPNQSNLKHTYSIKRNNSGYIQYMPYSNNFTVLLIPNYEGSEHFFKTSAYFFLGLILASNRNGVKGRIRIRNKFSVINCVLLLKEYCVFKKELGSCRLFIYCGRPNSQ